MTDSVEQYTADLQSSSDEARLTAAEELTYLGAEARPAAVELVKATADENEEVTEWAHAALEDLGAPDESQIEALCKLLTHTHQDVGFWAATLLGRLGNAAENAVPALCEALHEDVSVLVSQRITWALGVIGVAEAAPELEKLTDHENERLSRMATEALDELGGATKSDSACSD